MIRQIRRDFFRIRTMLILLLSMPFVAMAGEVSVTGIAAQQRYPWNGLVDIVVTLQGESNDVIVTECLFAATNSTTKAVIQVEHIVRNGSDSGMDNVWTRNFIWDAKADVGAVKIDDVELAVDAKLLGVQLWDQGPYWAECNVGATKPEECGYYFWWGDAVGYQYDGSRWNAADLSRIGFSFASKNCPTCGKSNETLRSDGYLTTGSRFAPAHDAATVHLGAPWRMPTHWDFSELLSNCTTMWTTCNGVSGLLVTGKGAYALRSIFLPAAGTGFEDNIVGVGSSFYYWSSTPASYNNYFSDCLYFFSGNLKVTDARRDSGFVVRPLRSFIR